MSLFEPFSSIDTLEEFFMDYQLDLQDGLITPEEVEAKYNEYVAYFLN